MPYMPPEAEARLEALLSATPEKWVALSADESRIIAEGETFEDVSRAVDATEEPDPLLIRVPTDWTPRVL